MMLVSLCQDTEQEAKAKAVVKEVLKMAVPGRGENHETGVS